MLQGCDLCHRAPGWALPDPRAWASPPWAGAGPGQAAGGKCSGGRTQPPPPRPLVLLGTATPGTRNPLGTRLLRKHTKLHAFHFALIKKKKIQAR